MHALPRLSGSTALFLDFDGTLVDIAAQPELVHTPPQLPLLIQILHARLGGALAIVTGRTIAEIDHFLAPLHLPIAGEHGARRRSAAGLLFAVNAPDLQPITAAGLASNTHLPCSKTTPGTCCTAACRVSRQSASSVGAWR